MRNRIIISCEHGGNEIPPRYKSLFAGHEKLLQSHRGWDEGARELAVHFGQKMQVPPYIQTVSRLLVEANRSLHNPQLFSEVTKSLDKAERQDIITSYYDPYRDRIRSRVEEAIAAGRRVIHLSVHTFTPVWEGERRAVDIGFLYDPARTGEEKRCRQWRANVEERLPAYDCRMNEPYSSTDDGFTTALRTLFDAESYVGIELEVNQRFPQAGGAEWKRVKEELVLSLLPVVKD